MRLLVTGGAGFIGSHVVGALVADGHRVRVYDDLSTGNVRNLDAVRGSVDLVVGDLRDRELVFRAVDGCEAVLHLAALGSVPRSLAEPQSTHDVNATGTLNLLEAVVKHDVETIVFSSSSSVYGDSDHVEKSESQPVNPISPYGASKLAAEAYCLAFARSFGFHALALRYFNVFGPRQNPAGAYAAVIPSFILSALERRPWTINGDGHHSRDFTFVSNVVDANLRALERAPRVEPMAMNVACGDSISLLELSGAISDLTHAGDITPVFGPERPGDIVRSQADITRAREVLGFEVVVDWRSGLAETVDWYSSQFAGKG